VKFKILFPIEYNECDKSAPVYKDIQFLMSVIGCYYMDIGKLLYDNVRLDKYGSLKEKVINITSSVILWIDSEDQKIKIETTIPNGNWVEIECCL
jgi:hypothetical protein